MSSGYTIQIEPGQYPETWVWEITAPDGSFHAAGASTKAKGHIKKELNEYLKRNNIINGPNNRSAVIGNDIARQMERRRPQGATSRFTKKQDQVIRDFYPTGGWRKTYEALAGKFTKGQIQRRAAYLGVKSKRYAKSRRRAA